jgi:hypothetical protein
MKFISNRSFTLTSLTGHSINFEKGVPAYVPKECHREAIGAGCVADDGEVDMGDKKPEVVLNEDERLEMLRMVLVDMKSRNDRDEFTATGAPKVKAVEKLAGFDTTTAEIAELWAGLNQAA